MMKIDDQAIDFNFDEIDMQELEARARQMRAEAIKYGYKTTVAWVKSLFSSRVATAARSA